MEIRIKYFEKKIENPIIGNHSNYNYSKDGEGISFEIY